MAKPDPSLVHRIKAMTGGADFTPFKDPDEDKEKQYYTNRAAQRRVGKRSKPTGETSVHDALRMGANPGKAKGKTGKPHWFKQMQYEAKRKKALKSIPIVNLQSAVGDIVKELHAAGFRTVLDVVEVGDINKFLVHGMRSKNLKHLQEYLKRQGVETSWTC